MIVLVTGGRGYSNIHAVFNALDTWHRRNQITEIVTGACHKLGMLAGADGLAIQWALTREVDFTGFPAKFRTQGKPGGPIRNERVIRSKSPNVCIWFPGGAGTANCVGLAAKFGIPIYEGERL